MFSLQTSSDEKLLPAWRSRPEWALSHARHCWAEQHAAYALPAPAVDMCREPPQLGAVGAAKVLSQEQAGWQPTVFR